MNLSFNGFGENVITFEADPALDCAGVAVKVTQEGKAAAAAAGDKICGVAVNVRAGFAAVQLKGYMELASAQKIPCGYQNVSVDAQGKLVTSDEGTQVLVVTSEEDKAGFIL